MGQQKYHGIYGLSDMARLYRYSSSNDKSGYFLRGWTPNTGNTTIQVTKVASDIFDWLNLQPEDQIPNDLLYAMLDTGLVYTDSGGSQQNEYSVDVQRIENSLSETQFQRLIGFLKSFDDDAPSSVRQLASALGAKSRQVVGESIPDTAKYPTTTDSSRTKTAELESIVNRVFRDRDGLPDLHEHTISTIKQVPGSVLLEDIDALPNGEPLVQAMASYPGTVRRVSTSDTGIHYSTPAPSPQSTDQFAPIGNCRVSDRSTPESTEIQVSMVFSLSDPYKLRTGQSEDDFVSYVWEVIDGKVTKFNIHAFTSDTDSEDAEQKVRNLESFFFDVLELFTEHHPRLSSSILSHFDYGETNPEIMDSSASEIESGYITNILQHQSKFGFIRSSKYDQNVFFHESELQDHIDQYSIGDYVRFKIQETEKGLQANDLEHVSPPDTEPSPPRLLFTQDNLIKLDVDCIVLPQQASPKLKGNLGKSAKAVGGMMLEKDAAAYQPMVPGSIFVTDGRLLNADFVIHAVTADGNSTLDEHGIEDMYQSVFEAAKSLDVSSIAMPLMGTEHCHLSIDSSVQTLIDSTWSGLGLSETRVAIPSEEAYSIAIGKEV
jgi:O-acetyl-ADP-ribose deacetylase (regulator of RNase III)/cold shock CspA family protein